MVEKNPALPVFHVRRVRSTAGYDANDSPFESKQTEVTLPVCPSRILHLALVLTSYIPMGPSCVPTASL